MDPRARDRSDCLLHEDGLSQVSIPSALGLLQEGPVDFTALWHMPLTEAEQTPHMSIIQRYTHLAGSAVLKAWGLASDDGGEKPFSPCEVP